MVLKDYPNLEEVEILGNYLKSPLTKLEIKNCPKIKEINCSNNKLVEIKIDDCSQIRKFMCSNNELTNLENLNNFLDPKSLVSLIVSGNN